MVGPGRPPVSRATIGGAAAVGAPPCGTAGTAEPPSRAVVVAGPPRRFVSRGGEKLDAALSRFEVDPAALDALDAGASTGGFTDVLLSRGAREVVAADVGYGQLVWRLRSDDRVHVHDRTNVRTLEPGPIGGPVDLTVADLSFISLRTVLPALAACTAEGGDLLPMVKPQFEVGRGRLGSGGVVRSPELRTEALRGVADAAGGLGLRVLGATASPLPGPSGNVEYFLHLRREAGPTTGLDALLATAVSDGPA